MLDIDIKEVRESLDIILKYIKQFRKRDRSFIRCTLSDFKKIRKICWKILKQLEETTKTLNIKPILDRYDKKIHKLRKRNNEYYVTPDAKNKIFKRLEIFSEEEIFEAIDNFSNDDWWMQHNSHRGIAWFFHNSDRIQLFIDMTKTKKEEETTDPAILKLKKLTENTIRKIFPVKEENKNINKDGS